MSNLVNLAQLRDGNVSTPGAVQRPRFGETPGAKLRRWALGTAYALQPKRIRLLPKLTLLTGAHFLKRSSDRKRRLPDDLLPYGKEGLLGISGDLSVDALVDAYQRGIIPVCHMGPMKWWSPAERAVLFFRKAQIESGVRKKIRQDRFDFTFDHDFAAVMRACAEPRPGKAPLTWLTPRVMDALWDLHEAGYAHSIEVWDLEPKLVGGIFGIAIGHVFFGESQFSRVRDASKVASAVLNCHLASWGFVLRDAKWMSSHLAGSGFEMIDRQTFQDLLTEHAWAPSRLGRWDIDETLDPATWDPRTGARP